MSRRLTLVLATVLVVATGSGQVPAAVRADHGGSNGCGGIPVSSLAAWAPSSTTSGGDPGSAGSIPFKQAASSLEVLLEPGSVGGIPAGATRTRTFSGNPDGVGGIPHSGGVGGIPAIVHFAPTAGLILDSTNAPISGAPVLVFACDGAPIAATTTDELGGFVLTLPKAAGLTLVLPTLGVDDVPIVAGHPLLIIVP